MTVALYSHAACLEHDTGPDHPETAARLAAVLACLKTPEFAALSWREAPLAEIVQLERVHGRDYIQAVLAAVPRSGRILLDGDTILSPGSGIAALRAAGAACAAVDAVITGTARHAFCAVRPPGHHAEPDKAMGFCLFNTVAIAARHARAVHGFERVAVVDFDVHHGNGTQAAFAADPEVFFASTHQMPLYPGTGAREERGQGNIINVPLAPGSDGEAFRAAWRVEILPALEQFQPQLILVSAGFDGHVADPLANLRLESADYAWITQQLRQMAERHGDGRLVSTLEGGYKISALTACVAAHVRALATDMET